MRDLTNVPSTRVHLYECQDCVALFAGEDHEELNHSDITCPFCGGEHIDDAGYGVVVVTALPEFSDDEHVGEMQLPDPEVGGGSPDATI